MLLRSRLPLGLFLSAVAVSGCQCNLNNDDLTGIPDAGNDVPDAGPPPPKFPLKAGDHVQFPGLGGRTATCDGSATPGDCQRAITAEYIIADVSLNGENRWEITADVVYQGSDDFIPAAAIIPLVLDNGAPFAAVTEATPSAVEGAVFTTNTPAVPDTGIFTPNGFPFLQYGSDADDAEVFEEAGNAFCDYYTGVDTEANCEIQLADQKMEVFFKDELSGAAKLHKVRAEYHQMGFVCGWDELMIPFVDGMARDQSDFEAGDVPDLAAIFASPVKVIRDGVTYNCSCFSQQCRASDATCLSPDPDAAPGPCE